MAEGAYSRKRKSSSKQAILGLQPRVKTALLGLKTMNFFGIIYMKIEWSSQRREMLLFLTTDMAAVTSRASQQ